MEKEKSLKEKIQDFYKNGGRYEEKEIDFGKPKGRRFYKNLEFFL